MPSTQVMHEFKKGNLHSGKGGKVVKSRSQAIAIMLSEKAKEHAGSYAAKKRFGEEVMSDTYKRAPEASGSSVVKGNAATGGPDYDKIGEQADWDAYKKANKLSFAATRAQHTQPFAAYRAAQRLKREADSAARAKTISTTKLP